MHSLCPHLPKSDMMPATRRVGMEMWSEYFCWQEGQSEAEAKVIKTDSVKEAARLAVNSWRHEGLLGALQPSLLVYVRDTDGKVHHVQMNMDRYLDDEGPCV